MIHPESSRLSARSPAISRYPHAGADRWRRVAGLAERALARISPATSNLRVCHAPVPDEATGMW
jgi:hypothetical protein